MAMNKRAWRFLPAFLCMLAIFIFSARSGDQLDSVLPWIQEWLPWLTDFNPMHYVAYFVLSLTVAFGLGKLSGTWLGCLLNVAICTLYGITDEWHQAYVPMRSPDSLDLWHDAIGAGAASLLVLLGSHLNKRRNSRNYTNR